MENKILIIDDEKDLTDLLSTFLSFHDFQVDTINDPLETEKHLGNSNYALIIIDLMMPNMDGFELISKIKGNEHHKDTSIIVISSKVLTDSERRFLFQNKAQFIAKPYEPQTLLNHITEVLHGMES